ncbi:hypothetical protein [Flavobacterium sp. J27]|uniref:hypothetical protein n=1 Tax=Flavobacterium sp. J27 TaxID=2060419 RepID=UPI0010314A8B|nr:hypothetical protein [Flavobacterium sp. J27]
MKRINLLIILLVLISCSNSNYTKDEKCLIDFLQDESFLRTKKCIVLVPVNGCGTCTQDIIKFSKKNYRNENILFIYSAWDRQAKVLYKEIEDFEKHVVIDKKSTLKSLGIVENKPIVFFIEKYRIKEKIKFDDKNSDQIIDRINKLIN